VSIKRVRENHREQTQCQRFQKDQWEGAILLIISIIIIHCLTVYCLVVHAFLTRYRTWVICDTWKFLVQLPPLTSGHYDVCSCRNARVEVGLVRMVGVVFSSPYTTLDNMCFYGQLFHLAYTVIEVKQSNWVLVELSRLIAQEWHWIWWMKALLSPIKILLLFRHS